MPVPEVEITRERFEAFLDLLNARDFDAIAERLGSDVEFGSVIGDAEGTASYAGLDGLRKWAEEVDATWEGWRQEVVDFHKVSDDQAVLVTRATGRAKASGVPLDTLTGNVLTRRPGRGWQLRAYSDPRAAFEAVGLRQ